MKKLNWKVLNNISKDCIWKQLSHSGAEERDIFDGLKQEFSLPNQKGKSDASVAKPQIKLKILDGMSAQNVLISLRVLFKNATYEEIKMHILHCDESILSSAFIETLVKHLPQPLEMKKLHQMNNEVELADVEKFVAILGDIERLVPRLNCINFKLGFNELVENLKPNLEAGRSACLEITASSKFREILSLILQIGNMMNSEKGKTTGFDLAILAELHTVKSSNTKRTLLHFIG